MYRPGGTASFVADNGAKRTRLIPSVDRVADDQALLRLMELVIGQIQVVELHPTGRAHRPVDR